MTIQVNVHEAKTRLSELLQAVERGEEVIIARAGKPVVRLSRFQSADPAKKRELGWLKGRWKAPEDIKGPFEEDIKQMFELGE